MKRIAALLLSVALLAGCLPGVAVANTMYYIPGLTSGDFGSYYLSNRLYFQGDSEATLLKGKTKKLKLAGATAGVTWKSSNKKVATVSKAGTVKTKKAGKAVITATNASGFSADFTVKVYVKRTQAQARKAILALKAKYPEGRRWTNSNHYNWEAANTSCYGCAAFAGIASDKAFGKYAPFRKHKSFDKVKVGDSIRIGDWHSVVVLYKKSDSVVVCEGNYNSSIHWGATLTRSWLANEGFQVWTRY